MTLPVRSIVLSLGLVAARVWSYPAPTPSALAPTAVSPIVICADGGWCWYQDERAVFVGDDLLVGSLSRAGDVDVTVLDLPSRTPVTLTLHAALQADDHDVASFLHRADGHLMAFYSKHGTDLYMRYRVSARPDDPTSWLPERILTNTTGGVTYSNPFQLSGEGGRIYLFYRGVGFNPTYVTSDDNGETWSVPARLIDSPSERPYVKYCSDGSNTIHFVFTEAHPDEFEPTSLYHMVYRNGGLYRSDGSFIANLAAGPVTPAQATRVYDGTNATGEAWTWDAHLDADGRPVIPYATFASRSPDDHRYRYARWDGTRWHDHPVAFAGTRLYSSQASYSGGIAVDPEQPEVVYLSSDVNITNGLSNGSGRHELYRGVTPDYGATWTWRALTAGSASDNLRPIVPVGHTNETTVLWLRGTYTTYTDYDLEVCGLFGSNLVAAAEAVPPESAFRIDLNDADDAATAPGWVGLDAAHTGGGGSVTSGGITFTLSGAQGARRRAGADPLTGDFVYGDGAGAEVGLLLGGPGGLPAGVWEADVYCWDAGYALGDVTVLYRENGAERVASAYAWPTNSGPVTTFRFVSDGVSAYGLFVRENNAANRSRLNAVELRRLDYRVDLNDAGASATQPGWLGLDAWRVGNGGSVTTNGVTFAPFSADGAALRGTAASPAPDALLGDFVYDDGPGVAVGLLFGGAGDLQAGRWRADVYMYDADFADIAARVGWRRGGAETLVGAAVPGSASGPACAFSFVSDGASAYDVFTREANGGDRSRLNAVWLRPCTNAAVLARYDMDDGAADVSASAASATTPEEADAAAPHVAASALSALQKWGMDVPPVNANIARNSTDGCAWWSRAELVPAGVNTGADPHAAFTLAAEDRRRLDLREGVLLLRMGCADNNAAGSYAVTAHLYRDDGGALTPLGSAAAATVDNNAGLPLYRDLGFDLSPVGVVSNAVTFRLYFSDASAQATQYPILDTVTVLGGVIEPEPLGTALLIR